MKKNLQTEAGQTKASGQAQASAQQSVQHALIDALNQVFALFKRNYHNQFFKAYAQESDVIAVKRLWLENLKSYDAQTILEASMAVVKTSEFLPTLKTMLNHCERVSKRALPDVRTAYAEACNASSPKIEQNWSHPAVYLTGRDIGWHFLQSNTENVAFPVFKERYLSMVERARAGEQFALPEVQVAGHIEQQPASQETTQKYMDSLQSLFDEQK
ncbi:replication protein P [Agaribacterium sp. ZY112]|uniref:replication protein P n=1 Tax=Agaribacterium sp. ZY112 TaxID=3233574 RepID=UPI0035259DC4